MIYVKQFPLTIAPLGTNKQDGFTKLTAEDQAIYDILNTGAAGVVNTPAGSIASTTVQAALNELGTKKVALSGGSLTGSLHQPNPVNITSALGILTLLETSNSFIANGAEAITSITGWTSGTAVIRWNTARTLTYNAASLILQGAVNRTTAIGDVGVYEMTAVGAREIGYFPATTPSTAGQLRNLKILVTSNTAATITADEVPLRDASNTPLSVFGVNLTLNTGTVGANALDAGAVAASTWYSVWVIAKPDGTVAGLLSTSTTAPTMPGGYTFKARLGWVKTNASSFLYRTIQYGRKAQYIIDGTILSANLIIASGAMAISPIAVVGVAIPPTASVFRGSVVLNGASLHVYLSASANGYITYANVSSFMIAYCEIILETTNIYYYSDAAGNSAYCYGWEDNL